MNKFKTKEIIIINSKIIKLYENKIISEEVYKILKKYNYIL